MSKDQLYLMKPNFMNAGLGPFYCGDSVSIEGLLGFFPQLRDTVDINYIDFPRPRQALVDSIGENQQSIPVLILAVDALGVPEVETKSANGRRFIDNEKGIREYLSVVNGLPRSG
jgi:hypothetical protein